jgi:hypothetical protein
MSTVHQAMQHAMSWRRTFYNGSRSLTRKRMAIRGMILAVLFSNRQRGIRGLGSADSSADLAGKSDGTSAGGNVPYGSFCTRLSSSAESYGDRREESITFRNISKSLFIIFL